MGNFMTKEQFDAKMEPILATKQAPPASFKPQVVKYGDVNHPRGGTVTAFLPDGTMAATAFIVMGPGQMAMMGIRGVYTIDEATNKLTLKSEMNIKPPAGATETETPHKTMTILEDGTLLNDDAAEEKKMKELGLDKVVTFFEAGKEANPLDYLPKEAGGTCGSDYVAQEIPPCPQCGKKPEEWDQPNKGLCSGDKTFCGDKCWKDSFNNK